MTVGNFTDLEQKVGDCVICSIRVDSIPKLPEGAIGFIFPNLFMKEDLLRCAGVLHVPKEYGLFIAK